MKNLRREDLSLHHYLRFNVLSDFIETSSSITLEYLPDESSAGSYVYQANPFYGISDVTDVGPSHTSRGRGWKYIDDYGDTTEQTGIVTVYNTSDAIIPVINPVTSGTNYIVDYVDGRIIFSINTLSPSYVDYSWCYVAIVNDWDVVEAVDTPVVVVDINKTQKRGFQLGGGREVLREVDLHVFAADQGERDDITEALYDGLYLKCCPYQEFNNGTMMDWNGTFNDAYTYSTISGSSSLRIEDVKTRNIFTQFFMVPSRDSTMLSDLNKYRSRVSFDMLHWEEA